MGFAVSLLGIGFALSGMGMGLLGDNAVIKILQAGFGQAKTGQRYSHLVASTLSLRTVGPAIVVSHKSLCDIQLLLEGLPH